MIWIKKKTTTTQNSFNKQTETNGSAVSLWQLASEVDVHIHFINVIRFFQLYFINVIRFFQLFVTFVFFQHDTNK